MLPINSSFSSSGKSSTNRILNIIREEEYIPNINPNDAFDKNALEVKDLNFLYY